jgi:hypothetical protein
VAFFCRRIRSATCRPVEAGLILDIKKLVAMGALVPGPYRRGSLTSQMEPALCFSDAWVLANNFVTGFRYVPPCRITVVDAGGSSARSRKSESPSCTCRQAPPSSPAGRRTTSPTAPAGRVAGENDQKSFGAAWPSDSPLTLNSGWLPWDNPHGRLLAYVRARLPSSR